MPLRSLPTTVLLTLGRLPKALEIARALAAAGCRVLVAEPFRHHLTGASRAVARSFVVRSPVADAPGYLEDLLHIVRREGVELVVPVSEEVLFAAALHERLPAGVRLACGPAVQLRQLHDKLAFITACRDAGVAAPATARLEDPAAAGIATAGRHVVKPIHSCSGRAVQFRAAGEPLPAVSEPAIAQSFCEGALLSTFSIVRAGRPRLTVTYLGAVMQGTVAVCFERIDTPAAVARWVGDFVAHVGFDGFVSFDLVLGEDGVVRGIECNPRATSGIHFVMPESIAAALLDPDDDGPLNFRPQRLLQQFFPCLTETQRSVFAGGAFRRNLRHLMAARDVTWDRRDPWPLISMPVTSWTIIKEALRQQRTFGEVAMLDLAWSGEVPICH